MVIIDADIGASGIEVYEITENYELPIRLEDSYSVDPLRLVEIASAGGFKGKVFLDSMCAPPGALRKE